MKTGTTNRHKMTPETFNVSTIGATHVAQMKPCQDYSLCMTKDDMTVAVVCDGHGGEPHFRSQIGAKIAAEVAAKNMFDFMTRRMNLFEKISFTEGTTVKNNNNVNVVISDLVANILSEWSSKVLEYDKASPITAEEEKVISKDILDFHKTGKFTECAYGTTLLIYAQSQSFWIALQIGDGMIISRKDEDWFVTVPDDEECEANVTTSLCDSSAEKEFRYSVEGNNNFPDIAFLCSDGLEKCFNTAEDLAGFYQGMYELIEADLYGESVNEMKSIIKKYSTSVGSDDISLAYVYNRK